MKAKKTTSSQSFAQKMSIMAGSMAVLAFPEAAEAGIIFENMNPRTVNFSGAGSVEWDVDGNGDNDFVLLNNFNSTTSQFIRLDSNGGRFGGGLVRQNGDIGSDAAFRNLASGFIVGSALATNYSFSPSGVGSRTFISATSFNPIGVRANFVGGVEGDNFIGFAFDSDGTTLYGWAKLVIDLANGVTISEWAYEDTGASIAVGATSGGGQPPVTTPEGDTGAALLLLGMGAAGIRQWRKRKQAKLAQDSQE